MSTLPHASQRWDGRYELRFPYNRNLVEALKADIPAAYREYEPITKTWIIDAGYVAEAIDLLKFFFPDARVSGSHEASSQRPTTHRSNPHAVLYVLPDAPKCVIEAAFRALSKEVHPDRAPAEQRDQAHERMIVLNEAFAALRDRIEA